jgi:hypothetical protein
VEVDEPLTAEQLFECTSERLFVAHMFTERAFRVKHSGTESGDVRPLPPLTVTPPGEDDPMTATALRTAAPTGAPRRSAAVATRRPSAVADRRQRTVAIRQPEPANRLPAHVYRRRRLLAVAAGVLLVAVVVLLAGRVGRATADLDGPPPAPAVYVVQPGDTLWSIAERVAPDADRREVVGRLSDAAGGSELVPGQRIELPRYFD